MGVLFIVMALIVLIRNIIIWGPGFVLDFLLSSEITNEKVSLTMIAFGSFLIIVGFKKRMLENR
jgi:hypothetical protein